MAIMIQKSARIMNKLFITLKDKTGNIVLQQEVTNTTCNKGRESIAKRLVDYSSETSKLGVIQLISIGDGLSSATEQDIKLENELARKNIDANLSIQTDTVVEVETTFGTGLEANISEAGLFVDSTADESVLNTGSLLAHSTFTNPIQKLSTQTLTIRWRVSILNTI